MPTQPDNSTNKYVFSSPAYWLNGGYGFGMSKPKGTLGLTASGRVEFTLDSGKVMFSAPVALTKRMYEHSFGWMRIVVGPRLYVLQFHTNDLSASYYLLAGGGGTTGIALTESASKRGLRNVWQTHLEQAAKQSPDNEPIVAALTPPSLKATARKVNRGLTLQMWATWFIFLALIGVGYAALKAGASGPQLYILITILTIPVSIVTYRYNRRNKRVDQDPLPTEEVATAPQDLLPAGTMATGSFGMTQGKQFLLGVLLVPVFFFGIAILGAIAVAIWLAFSG